MLHLPLLQYQPKLTFKKDSTPKQVLCLIRKKYIVLTPEEVVRQLLLHHLIEDLGYPKNKIRVELGVEVNGMMKRCDILVYNEAFEPVLLVECKSAKVAISSSVFEQIAMYNMTLKVPYLLLSNGVEAYCAAIWYERNDFEFLSEVPKYSEAKS